MEASELKLCWEFAHTLEEEFASRWESAGGEENEQTQLAQDLLSLEASTIQQNQLMNIFRVGFILSCMSASILSKRIPDLTKDELCALLIMRKAAFVEILDLELELTMYPNATTR